jgi:hypothetical protein
MRRLLALLGGCGAMALLLAVPAFAFRAMTPGTADTVAAIAPADDVVANGLQIVDAPAADKVAPRSGARLTTETETVLRGWTYTGHPSPSPGH